MGEGLLEEDSLAARHLVLHQREEASSGLNQTRSRASWRGRQSPATGTM